MLTVNKIMHALTDPKTVMGAVRETLREIDAKFPAEEAAYEDALKVIREKIPQAMLPHVEEYLDLQDRALTAELLFLLWGGLQQNLECFYHPASRMFYRMDYEDIHSEEILHSMPATSRFAAKSYALHQSMASELTDLLDPVMSYYCYIQTTGYKLAHYLGFILGDRLLQYVIPGYVPTHALSLSYHSEMKRFTNMDIDKLTA